MSTITGTAGGNAATGRREVGRRGADGRDREAEGRHAAGRESSVVGRAVPAAPLPDGHPLAPLAPLGLGDVRLVPVPGAGLGTTSVVALVGDPLSSIAPLVRLHRGYPPGAPLGHVGFGADRELVRAFRRLREDGAGVLVFHRDDGDPSRTDDGPPRRALGVPDRSPGLRALATTIASLGLHPARLLVPAVPDPDGLDPRDVGLPVIRSTTFGPGRGPLRPRALVW